MRSRLGSGAVLVTLFACAVARAAAPTMINFQGKLTDTGEIPIDGTVQIVLTIFDAPADGAQQWTETHAAVTVTNGLFSVLLGGTVPITPGVLSAGECWLEMEVGGELMTPRQRIVSVAYAQVAAQAESAGDADTVDGMHAAGLLDKATYDADADGKVDAAASAVCAVPIGAVIDWWRPDASFPVPAGFQICDGAVISDPDSPLDGFSLPNLADKFIRGVTDPANIGVEGGSDTHDHAVAVPDHSHTADISHDHAVAAGSSSTTGWHTHDVDPASAATTSGDPHTHSITGSSPSTTTEAHNHRWAAFDTGYDWCTYDSLGTLFKLIEGGDGMKCTGSGYYPLGHNGGYSGEYFYTNNNSHSHTVAIADHSTETESAHAHSVDIPATTSSSADDHSHSVSVDLPNHTESKASSAAGAANVTSAAASSLPSYCGLLKIMRIK